MRGLFTKKSTLARDKAVKATKTHCFLITIMMRYLKLYLNMDRHGAVDITTRYGLNGPGLELRWMRHFPDLSRMASRPTQPPVQWMPGRSHV